MSSRTEKYQGRAKKAKKKEESGLMEFLNKDIPLGKKRFNDKRKAQFYNDLYTLLDAGLNLNAALQLLDEENREKEKDNVYAQLRKEILVGKSLSMSMKEAGKFTNYEYQSVKIGEETGQLAQLMGELKNHFDRKIKLRQQFVGLVTYPIIVIVIALGVMTFLLNYVVPMFIGFLTQVGAELPAVTQFVLDMSEVFAAWYKPVFGVLLVVVLFFYFQRETEWFRKSSGNIVLRLPLVGKMMNRVYMSRFCQSMSLLMNAKVPLVDALEMTGKMVDFYPIEKSLERVGKEILKGKTFHESMRNEKVFDQRMVSMIRVGEEVNKLDDVFAKLTEQYSDSVENQSKVLKSIVEPVLIMVVGGVVALVAMAMILPIFKMSSTMEF